MDENERIINSIITRLQGVIDAKKAAAIYEEAGIILNEGKAPVINADPAKALNDLLCNIIDKGDYLAKITLRNVADENNLKICPLCTDSKKKKSEAKNFVENGDEPEIKAENAPKEEKPDKDLNINVLNSSPTRKIILVSLRNGATLDDHAANCPISVVCVSGNGTFEVEGKTQDLKEGVALSLDARVVHNVKAKNDLEILITKFMAA